jgi:hypothetical protein
MVARVGTIAGGCLGMWPVGMTHPAVPPALGTRRDPLTTDGGILPART